MDPIENRIRALQVSTAARSVLISYGIAAFSYFMLRVNPPGVPASGAGLFAAGLVIQLAVLVANSVVKRRIADAELAAQARFAIALLADGVTVTLFAIGTFGAIASAVALQ